MAFNEENAAKVRVEEPTGSVFLEEEDRNEVEECLEVDRKRDILKRLDAISDSLSFHSEFLQKLNEKRIIATEQDRVTVFKFEEKSEVNNGENSTNHVVKEIERESNEINVQYSFDYNLDTMLYYSVGEFNIAKIRNEEVLRLMPENFNALWNKVKLMIAMAKETGDCIDTRAEEILNQLEQMVSHNGKQMLIAKAEIAAMYIDLPVTSESLIRCIRLYEEVLAETNLPKHHDCAERLPEKLIIFWKCYLVRAYAMLTNANKELLANYGFDHGEVLSRLEELVLAIDNSEHILNYLKAEAWVNLANTFEHFNRNCPTYFFRRDVCSGLSLVDLFANARKYAPYNHLIQMRSGRELRQRAKSVQELREAIRLLKRSLKGEGIDAIQDITYHHIGLAYKALWIRTEHPICEKIIENAYKFSRSNQIPRTPHISPPLGCRVIKPPNRPLDFNLIPAPYKEPSSAAFWKILIPIAHNPEHPYLLTAIKCFEKANRSYDGVSYRPTLYFLDIARTYSNMRNVEKAREYFQKTLNDEGSDSVDVDFVGVSIFENLAHFEECEMIRKAFKSFESKYIQDTLKNANSNSAAEVFVHVRLFENLAQFEESEMIREAFRNSESEKVKNLYRESIRLSTISKTKTFVAFHYILRILYKQLTLNADNPLPEMDQMILQNEYFLLYVSIQEVENSYTIVDSIATDDIRITLMWRLIEMFNRRNQEYDAAAAFTYLSVLVMSKKLTTEVKGITMTTTEKQRILIQSAERVTLQRVTQPRFLPEPYRQLHALREDDVEEDASSCSNMVHALTDMEKKKLDIVMKIIQPDFIV